MFRFAANLSLMFTEHPFLDRFEAAAEAGFRTVEFQFPYAVPADAVAERLDRFSLMPTVFNLPPGDWDAGERGLAALPHRFDEMCDGVERGIAYARAIGVRRLHLMAGLAAWNDADAQRAYRRSIAHAAGRLAEAGVDLLIEPINRRSMPGYFLADIDAAAALIAELGLPNLRLQFDIFHCQILHGDVTTRLRRLMPIIGHIQIAGVPERHEPGTGELDDHRLLAEIDRLGYRDVVGCEYVPRGDTLEGLGWFEPYRSRQTA